MAGKSCALSLILWLRRRPRCHQSVLYAIVLVTMTAQAAPCQVTVDTSTHPKRDAALEFFEEPNWQKVCSQALAAPLPPTAARLARLAVDRPAPVAGQCDEQALYYGFGKHPDYRAALECAYGHRAHPDSPSKSSLEGAGTLALLYGNGRGVPREYGLAIRFACEVGDRGGSNEAERLGRLEALRDGKLPARTPFDLCDEQMSGAMGAYCSELSEKEADVGRRRRIAILKAHLPQQAKTMLAALQAAEIAFEEARVKGEYPGGGGSGSAGFALDDQNKLREQFVINLERFSVGKLPKISSISRQLAQQELDVAYTAALNVPRDPSAPFGEATMEGLRTTQAAWLELFEQWMQFVPIAYSDLSQDSASTELLRLRIHQLKRACY